uniref:PHD-type domain-containing protein n=1 Tax=Strix occidentalis caurina TaxID=311401 RepID=A0A8D0EVB8_STROC
MAPSPVPQGWSKGLGDNPAGTLPPAPQRCSFPPAFALSPPACVLCGRAEADLDLWGKKIEREEFCAHLFCLLLLSSLLQLYASKIFYWQDEESGLQAVLPEDIHCTVVRAAQKKCFVCGESGATITCCQEGCNRSFHLPCAMEGECVTQYFPPHRYLLSPPHPHRGRTQCFSPHSSLTSSSHCAAQSRAAVTLSSQP